MNHPSHIARQFFARAFLIAFVSVAFCAPKPSVHYPRTTLSLSGNTISTESAMIGLFGNYSTAEKRSVWISDSSPLIDFFQQGFKPPLEVITTVPAADTTDPLRVVFLLSTVPAKEFFQCRICSPVLSVAAFERGSGEWHLSQLQLLATPFGYNIGRYGAAPQASVIRSARTKQDFLWSLVICMEDLLLRHFISCQKSRTNIRSFSLCPPMKRIKACAIRTTLIQKISAVCLPRQVTDF